jgi:hypothetical protein
VDIGRRKPVDIVLSCRTPRSSWAALQLSALLAVAVGTAGAHDAALAKVGPELRALYDAYLAARTDGRPLVVPNPLVRVVEDRVIVDAIASDDVVGLAAGLVALGMKEAVTAGRIVSGQLPISAIPAMAALPGLTFARAAMPVNRSGAGGGLPAR